MLFAAALVGITPPPRDGLAEAHAPAAPSPPPAIVPEAAPAEPAPTPQPAPAPAPAPGPAAAAAIPAPKPKPAPAPFVVRRILDIPGPMRHGSWVWDDAGVPPGEIVVTVDLAAQTMSVFRGGYEIGAAVIIYGATDKPTPTGTFPISQKKRHHISNLYGAPMPYMLRLTNDGVAIHASEVEWGNATHGCIGLPPEFAAKLFGEAELGTRVIVTDGKHMALPSA
ncbi:L,D-transpeptidase [Sphingomonas gilva]|uniref:L,D-transpeptidase n=2 Tax=Sphingomonas gilva TaxID=2305907 RepID=A0A396RJY4_9SPHN|nr:L,D-transpeptidase [Sphingomonas gilva]